MKSDSSSLNLPDELDNPTKYFAPIDVADLTSEHLVEYLRRMLIIRKAEELIGDKVTSGQVQCPAHLGIGQEAVAVGLSAHLRTSDRIFGAHRSHSHFLAAGGSVFELFAEVLGRVSGASKGMGGSMHLHDSAHGFLGSVPIVGASVPIAVGAALAAQMDGMGDIAVSYFGDGAMEEGALHESLNLAATMRLPILFVCENNFFASHMQILLRQPFNSVARIARAHSIPAYVVDGNDVQVVSKTAEIAAQRARDGEGPSFIEAVTYRWRGHVGPREDLDVGVQRGDDLRLWKQRDPIQRLARALEMLDWLSIEGYADLDNEVKMLVDDAWQRAEQSPYPDPSALLELVYA